MSTSGDSKPQGTTKSPGNATILALTVISAGIGGTFQYGYNLSNISAPTTYIQTFINDTYMERWGTGLGFYQLTLVWTVTVAVYALGGWVGALLAGPLSVHCGRKKSLLINNVFLLSGDVLVLSCKVAKSFEMIIIYRILVGITAGISMNIQPMYFGESAPKHLRGAVALSSAIFAALGAVLGQVIGLAEVLGTEELWTYLLASNAVPSLIQLLTLPWLPESPKYLLIDRGDREACLQALRRLRGGEVPAVEIEEMLEEEQEQQKSAGSGPKSVCTLFRDQTLRAQLITVIVASSAIMFCGIDSIYSYATYVFLEAGIPPDKVQYATIGIGSSELTACIISSMLVERLGRRHLLIGGYSLMSCWFLIFTISVTLQGQGVEGMAYLSMACVFASIVSFGVGPAGVTGILAAEVFDLSARPSGYMIGGSFMWLSTFLVGMVFPFTVDFLGSYCFLPFLFVCLAAAIVLGIILPETKGKTMAEVTAAYERNNKKWKAKLQKQKVEPVGNDTQLDKSSVYSIDILTPHSQSDIMEVYTNLAFTTE